MNKITHISAVIFDMDGLMLDTEHLAQRAWRRTGVKWGYDISDDVYLQVIGRTAEDTAALFRQEFGADFPFEEMYVQKQRYIVGAVDTEGIPIKPGLLELLDALNGLDLAKAVATSTCRDLALKKLRITGLLNRFEIIVCGDEVDNGKPAPDIFLAAAERLQVSPQQCLVLEDSAAGIKAAYTAGMLPVMAPDLISPSAETESLAYDIISSLADVLPLIKRVNGLAE